MVGDLPLCHVRLQDDARYPWLVLIPRGPELVEIEDLSPADRVRLVEETVMAGRAVHALGAVLGFEVAKLNIGALGNVTPQLHVHVVGRRPGDPAWPGPVWGHSAGQPHGDRAAERVLLARIQLGL
nr:HIT domain-containing protein [Caulobacter sp. SLTY]